jgi:threonine dehydrogenase-like Zn-dependent dehydrogenase
MRAAVYRKGEIVVGTAPDPVPGKGQVLVRTLACGICGSDLHFRHHAHSFVDVAVRAGAGAFAMDLDRDIVLGHEFCAEVIEYGPDTERRFKAGTPVTSVPVGMAGGQSKTIGQSNEFPGGFGEYMVLTEALMLETPNGLAAAHAALTEPMAVGWHAAKIANLEAGALPLVIGCGPVGLAVIAALKVKGVGPIVAADFSDGRRRLAQTMGADVIVDPAQASPYEAWRNVSRETRQRACVIFECVGAKGMLRKVMEGAPSGAEIVVVGACMEADVIEPMFGIYKALTLKFALAYNGAEFAEMLRMIGEGVIDVSPLVTQSISLNDTPQAFEDLASPGSHAKIIVEPWR